MKKPHRTRESRLLERLRLLELQVDALSSPVISLIINNRVWDKERQQYTGAWAYFIELATLADLAHSGISRRDDAGFTSASHPTSRPPAHNPEAQRALKIELHELSVRADRIRATLQQIDPGVSAGVEVTDPGAGISAQTTTQTSVIGTWGRFSTTDGGEVIHG